MISVIFASLVHAPAPDISDYVQKDLRDATFVASKVKGVQKELAKINDDFGTSYKFDRIRFQYKEPLKLRLEAELDDTRALYIVNGEIQMFKVPRLRLNTKQDLSKSPGRRQTPLDFGVLTPGLFKDLFKAAFIRTDRASGDLVFDLTYQFTGDTSRHRVWIDKDKKIVNKREWYNQPGRQLATFIYEKPLQVGVVWLPTQMTVKNTDDVVAGITKYDALKVNTGLSDDLFELK